MSLIKELKRRNVFKVGFAYVVVAWLVAQILQLLFESFGTPDWAIKTVLVLLGTGLPFALFFAWAFELTPDGVKREHEVDRSRSVVTHTGKKLNNIIIAVMALALTYFAYDKFLLSEDRQAKRVEPVSQSASEPTARIEAGAGSGKSIAVLPFVNMSSDTEQEYFSDGISEELLNGLAKIESLKVAARTSSFSFKGQNKPIGEIARVLGVEHILEGSVRKSGTQIRVTAQLIRVSDGFHMWSETYDRELLNIFAIQDEITEAIVSELRVKLDVQAKISSATTNNPDAYQLYLQGRYFWNLREYENIQKSIDFFERATQIDPTYTDAWIGLGEAWVLLPGWGFDDIKAPQQFKNAWLAAKKALLLNPTSGRAYAVLAQTHTQKLEWREAIRNFELAIQYEPENASIWHWYGITLGTIGDFNASRDALRKAAELDPRSRIIGAANADELARSGNYDAALHRIDKTLAFAPDFLFGWQTKGFIHIMRGEFVEARVAFNRISELAGGKRFEMRTVDYIEESIQTGKAGPAPAWFSDPNVLDQYLVALALVLAGQYEGALDVLERQGRSNIPQTAFYYLNSVLFNEKMGHLPRYRELKKRLTHIEPDQ